MTSEELALEARAGSDACFRVLVERHRAALLGFLRKQGAREHDAEDLAQETFIRVHRKLHLFNPAYTFSTWLFTVARNLAIGRSRKMVLEDPVADVPEEIEEGPSTGGEMAENLWTLARARLPAAQADVLWLMYGEGLRVAEIAARLGLNRIHVRVLLHRARIRLADVMKEGGGVS